MLGDPAGGVSANAFRFLSLAVGIWGMLCAGNIYAFGLWSENFAKQLWDEKTDPHVDTKLSALYQWTLLGVYFPIGGFLYQWSGSRVLLLLGGLLMTGGYVLIYLASIHVISGDQTFVLSVAFFCVGHGTGYVDTGVVSSNLKNFSDFRGAVAGILKGYFGLSASVIALLYSSSTYIRNNILLLMGPVNGIIVLIACALTVEMRRTKLEFLHSQSDSGTNRLLLRSNGFEVVLTLVLLLNSVKATIEMEYGIESTEIWAVIMCIVLIFMNSFGVWFSSVTRESPQLETPPAATMPRNTLDPITEDAPVEETGPSTNSIVVPKPMFSAVVTIDFMCLFVALFVGTGAGLTVISNASRICTAKGGNTSTRAHIDLFVSLLSIWNCIGRLASGWISDQEFAKKAGFARERLLLHACLAMITGQSVLYFAETAITTFIGAAFVGMSYGAYWTLFPTLMMDLFGEQHFGINYSFLQLAPALGSLVFSRFLSTYLYEAAANNAPICVGLDCFGSTHLCIVFSLFVSLGFIVALIVRKERVDGYQTI